VARGPYRSPPNHLQELVLVQYDWQSEGLWIVRAAQARAVIGAMNLARAVSGSSVASGSFFETLKVARRQGYAGPAETGARSG